MSLVSISEILIPARSGGYAIGAFEAWNLESVRAVVSAAEGLSQPFPILSLTNKKNRTSSAMSRAYSPNPEQQRRG